MIKSTEHVRAYAARYRDMFLIRLLSVAGIVGLALWLMSWGWAANFAICQSAVYWLLWRVVERARTRPDEPGAWARLKGRTEILTLALALHTALFVLAAWRAEPSLTPHLLMLIGGNLMVGALQVHVSRLSFAAAVIPPSLAIGLIAVVEAGGDPGLLLAALLFVLGVTGAAWRQATSDRDTVELYVDLTQSSAALHTALDDARAGREAAETANRAKSRFLAMISHEVRTPLNVILGIVEVLRRKRRSKEEAGLVEDMGEAGGMLLRLLNGALDLSKIESGQSEPELAPVDIRARMGAVARVWRLRSEELGLTLEVDCDGAPGDFVIATDGGRVEQVVINLLSNALKLTPAGVIRIRAVARPAGDDAVTLRIEVEDQGPGVPEDQRERIFQPFEQLEAGRAAGGAGLGLAICRANIEGLGGRIGASAGADGGALFWFEIPARRALLGETAAPTGEVRPLSVLAAEDHEANRRLLALLLAQFGATVTLVENGAEAVAAARGGGFDLVLMDVMMPVMDGVQALAAIRAEEAGSGRPRLPVHMLTANVFDEDVARYRAAGADGVLRKPIEIEALHDTLAAVPAG
ncbi:ATP-binding protein [Brevundimonas sp. FT23042]|uniref:ATP-binding protein n=1 Tax=Brevundimonas sp. FT23042 TaxID=3393749 RepID=UPI003B586482